MDGFRRLGCAALAVATLALFGACSGDEFEDGSGGSAGTGPDGGAGSGGVSGAGATAGAGATGGAGGSGASGGSSGDGGGAGAGGGPPCQDGGCGPSEYCHSDGTCRSCTDLDELEFAKPEALDVINAKHSVDLKSARTIAGAKDLMYGVGNLLQPGQWAIWYTADFTQGAGDPLPAPVDGVDPGAGNLGEAGPFATEALTEGPLAKLSFFFDRFGTSSRRVMGTWYDSQIDNFVDPVELPEPFNPSADGRSSWEFVHAPLAKRAWFVSNRDGLGFDFKIYTAATGIGASPNAVSVSLATMPYNCAVEGQLEYGPWVSPDGTLMLFHARETAENCVYGSNTDLYLTVMDPKTGQAVGVSAFPLAVNAPNTTDSWPSMSWDMCWLYFSSNRELSSRLRLWRARRI